MTAFPMPAEDGNGVPGSLGDVAAPPALLRLPKYYQVKKQLLDFTAAMAPGSPVPPERELARLYGTSRTTVRQALAEQERLRREQLNPVEQGPVGRVAAAADTATAGNAILPQNPLAGSAPEAADATKRLAAQDPATTKALVRQNLGDRYSAAQTETQSGSRESAAESRWAMKISSS